MIRSNDLTRIPGYQPKDHDQLLTAMKAFVTDEEPCGKVMKQPFRNIVEARQTAPAFRCPCCHFRTLCGRGQDEICPVCFWEDDGQDDHDAEDVRGGPNRLLSLQAARANFLKCGAADPQFLANVRKPLHTEL